jgi:ubiquinone/menaquinone biosynthesis C-methylase UbiE
MRQRLEHASELLDEPRHDARELEQSLRHVAQVNRLLGGSRAAWLALLPLLTDARTTTILDVGTGSADIPLYLARRARRRGLPVRIVATDVHPQMRHLARRRVADHHDIIVGAADACRLPYADAAFDVVLLSMTLHHFEYAGQVEALLEAGRVAARGVIINELERCRTNYWGARLLAATLWRGNRLTRHDGPLSVLRAFTTAELRALAEQAGLRTELVERRFFHRIVLRAAAGGSSGPR